MPVDLNDFGEFGRYHLIRRMSLGGMAEVFKAKSYNDSGFEKVVALKRLLPSVAENDDFVAMFLQEAKIASRLDQENICRIYELGKVGTDYYLTMEFIYGHDLRQVLRGLKKQAVSADPWITAWVGAQAAEGLDYAYRQPGESGRPHQTVHRDISPQNVMIGFDGRVKIIDFGIAKAADATIQTAAGVLKGKYAYMSPEHASRQPLDARSDIWSLGVVLHELLSGRRLFVGSSMADTVDQVLHLEVPPLVGLPDGLAPIVARMLDRDIDSRYPDHGAVITDLHAFLATAPHPVNTRLVVRWMDSLFPEQERYEADLTDADVRLIMSAEERGEETTDMRTDVSEATQIFVMDETGQADYRAVLEQLLAQGRVHTAVTVADELAPELGAATLDPSAQKEASATPGPAARAPAAVLMDGLWAAVGLISVTWLLLFLLT